MPEDYNDSEFEDRDIQCVCGDIFVFTAGEQEFFADKGLTPPKRCPSCREKKRKEREAREGNA